MGWYGRVVSMNGKLRGATGGREMRERRILLNVFSITLAFAVMVLALLHSSAMSLASSTMGIASCACVLIPLLRGQHVPRYLIYASLALMCGSLVTADIVVRAIGYDSGAWPTFVLVTDLALILRLHRTTAPAIIILATLWIALSAAESWLRFGLFDLPGTHGVEFRRERLVDYCVCDTPPCSREFGITLWSMSYYWMVVVLDFCATRGFALEAEKEQAAMGRTIETVEAIAELLAGYDVDTVAEMLQEAEGRLPPAMFEALRRLEQNLRAYRPYLPAALFEQLHPEGEVVRQCPGTLPPGTHTEEAAIVFTDIRASTAIWEMAPEAMKKGIHTHNRVMRDVIAQFSGYEVKTIGDAFMVSFDEPRAAVNFGLTVQLRLLEADWPAGLLELPLCARTLGLWGGLTVRIGVNEGPVTVETNTLTGRVDYFGHTVNVAARLESVCTPGAVAVPAELWVRIRPDCLPASSGAPTLTQLRGVSIRHPVVHLWPDDLALRQGHTLSSTQTDTPDSTCSLVSGLGSTPSLFSVGQQLRHTKATIGSLCVAGTRGSAAGISQGLEAVAPLLEQSRGMLVTVLGACVLIGWNVGRATVAHAESSLRFAQRSIQSHGDVVQALGLASGMVQHGDVGTSRQRFVTVAGSAVDASLQLSHMACDVRRQCLYTSTDGFAVGSLYGLLRVSTALNNAPLWAAASEIGTVYELCSEGGGGSTTLPSRGGGVASSQS